MLNNSNSVDDTCHKVVTSVVHHLVLPHVQTGSFYFVLFSLIRRPLHHNRKYWNVQCWIVYLRCQHMVAPMFQYFACISLLEKDEGNQSKQVSCISTGVTC